MTILEFGIARMNVFLDASLRPHAMMGRHARTALFFSDV
jgi:hypothetical protein